MKKIYLAIASTIIISLISYFFIFSFTNNIVIEKPNYIELRNENNEVDYTYNHEYQGDYVYLKDVAEPFIKTLIFTEDKNFYSHHGFDYLRIIKSLIENFFAQENNQGASTITQQLAKNLYLTNEKTWTRKIQEAYIARRIESKYDKNYILELYINSVYFAHNIYGLKTASKFYFNKNPLQLNYQESCLLVGVINAPNIYSPFIDEIASKQKQKNIAYNLYQNNIISVDEYYQIINTETPLHGKIETENSLEKYYHQGIFLELEKRKLFTQKDLGLNITTYYRKDIQDLIEKTIKKYNLIDQISVIVMEPYSSKVLALSGGKNYQESQYNRAIESYRQIGSTIKPFIYYLGLKNGLTPLSKFTSEPTVFKLENGDTYTPKNNNNIYAYRKINMVEALGLSDNIYAVKTSLLVGSKKIQELMNLLGANIKNSTLAISLGGIEMTPLQLISAYNTLASEGRYYSPHFIKEVTLPNGTVIYQDKNRYSTILDYEECLIVNHLLKSSFDRGLITYSTPTMVPYQVKNTFACKTGTTSSSSWVVGFNQKYTILVYVGNDDNHNLTNGKEAKKIWRDIVSSLTIDNEDNFYTPRNSLKSFKLHNGIYSTYSFDYYQKR